MRALNKNIINPLISRIQKILFNLPKFMGLNKLGRRIYDKLKQSLIQPARGQTGVRGVLNFSGLAILLRLGVQYIRTWVAKITKLISPKLDMADTAKEEVKKLATALKDKFAETFPATFTKISKASAAGLGAVVGIFAAIYKSMTKVGELLAPAIDEMASRSRGEDYASALPDEDKPGFFAMKTFQFMRKKGTRKIPNEPEKYGQSAGQEINDAQAEQLRQLAAKYRDKKATTIQAMDDDEEINESLRKINYGGELVSTEY